MARIGDQTSICGMQLLAHILAIRGSYDMGQNLNTCFRFPVEWIKTTSMEEGVQEWKIRRYWRRDNMVNE